MNAPQRNQVLLTVLSLMLCAVSVWAWFHYMERTWQSSHYRSEAALSNPMLAAERLLTARGQKVVVHNNLTGALRRTPDAGVILVANNVNVMTPTQAQQLLAWVAKGGVLINTADTRANSEANASEVAPLSTQFDTWLEFTDSGDEDAAQAAEPTEADSAAETTAETPAEAAPSDDGETGEPAITDDAAAPPEAAPDTAEPATDGTEPAPEEAEAPAPAPAPKAKLPRNMVELQLPSLPYPLRLFRQGGYLDWGGDAPEPEWGDTDGEHVRAYRHGKGQVILLSHMPFDNDNLREADHGELLVALAGHGNADKPFWIVQGLDMPTWQEALWAYVPLGLVSLGLALLLWLWSAVMRFGPLLPDPQTDRRALMEHIDASGRWLWHARNGRITLLQAMRNATLAQLLRRSPDLQRLQPDALAQHLAERHKLPLELVELALHKAPANHPMDFFRQIQTLQTLRTSHER
ncbi:DUF4350 domain-containing protein [Chitinimonas viridis]|uniref:DUF4350 domain-containing protein n=1 Tax=Chitinimonas viridis TaxID=664880 RepID=A0ABT8B1P9_9NEIS|nr:DUF4350 domain-containing protein [Chitinimonas viridis]MDN3575414.1 DUF4350 domain-containing protein [Chitinimonas viridis]